MPQEIERKFLVNSDEWRAGAEGEAYKQGYIVSNAEHSVRVRVICDRGYLTIKSGVKGISRAEFEYEIPVADAEEMLQTLCQPPLIEKTRYKIPINGLIWEVDEFAGANAGLILAEVELTDEAQSIELPTWIGEEVSHDLRYFNSNLARVPYTTWQ